jgi:hypothetical protein
VGVATSNPGMRAHLAGDAGDAVEGWVTEEQLPGTPSKLKLVVPVHLPGRTHGVARRGRRCPAARPALGSPRLRAFFRLP